jgi:formylglycine-generating enzyme required for sulfatase activity
MVRIEGGTFIDDEGDEITIKPFYISKNLVTINQWNKHSEDKIDIKKYNAKYNINIKSEKYPAIFETEEKYGMVNIKDSLSLFKFCNSLSKSQGLEEYYSFVENNYGISTLFEHNNGFRLLSEYELKYILRKTKSEPYKNNVRSNTLAPVGSSDKNVFGIYDYDTNVAEVSDFDYVFKIKDTDQMLCGFRYAKDAENPIQELIIDFFLD